MEGYYYEYNVRSWVNTIELFVPFRFEKKLIDESCISKMFEHKAQYVSKGRYAITHILKSYGISDGLIAISAYMCPSVRETLIRKGYKITFYDIDLKDFNADFNSVSRLINRESPRAVVVASMYGNPANLKELELLCEEKKVLMIDDAAQSFGAKLDGRYVGSFGGGGFFSFSPGKPTAAHRGGYFWTLKSYEIKRSKHFFSSVLMYKSFYYNRYLAYEIHPIKSIVWKLIDTVFSRLSLNIENDAIEEYEKNIVGGVLDVSLNEAKNYREFWIQEFGKISITDYCYMIQPIRGDCSNNCKLVYVFRDIEAKEKMLDYLQSKCISYYEGYEIPLESDNCSNAKSIEGMVVELPIDGDNERMKYLKDCIQSFFQVRDKQHLK